MKLILHPFWCRDHEGVELYLYSLYGPYGLYGASVPVQGRALPEPFYVFQLILCFVDRASLYNLVNKSN